MFLWEIVCRKRSVSRSDQAVDRTSKFIELKSICFKLGVMLLAVEVERIDADGNSRIAVDVVPCDNCFVHSGSRAFLMCMSTDDVNRFVLSTIATDIRRSNCCSFVLESNTTVQSVVRISTM